MRVLNSSKASASTVSSLETAVNSLNDIKGFIYNGTQYNNRLYIRFVGTTIAHNSQVEASFTQFPHAALVAIPYCGHAGFAASSTVSVVSLSNGSIKLKQYNSANAQMVASAIIFGY